MSQLFDVDAFKAALTRGGARPNQFQIIIGNPSGVPVSFSPSQPLLISVAELPGQTVNPAIVQYRGREVKFAGDRVFAPWTMTVLNDSDFSVRTQIEAWMNAMDDREIKEGALDPVDYQSDITVQQLDRNGLILREYLIKGAFPVDLSPVALDFGANDQISTFTCTWQYQTFDITR